MTAHPDKGGSEAKMAALNEAYEVLSNPGTFQLCFPHASSTNNLIELRQRFDNGDDPNDQQAGSPFAGQASHPFAQFFQQQGGGGHGGFQFHYSYGGH